MSTTVYTYNDKVLVNSANDKWLKKPEVVDYVTIGTQTWKKDYLDIDDGQGGISTTTQGVKIYTFPAAVRVASTITGWHIPTPTETATLISYARNGGNQGDEWNPLTATTGWPTVTYGGDTRDLNGTNTSGFNLKYFSGARFSPDWAYPMLVNSDTAVIWEYTDIHSGHNDNMRGMIAFYQWNQWGKFAYYISNYDVNKDGNGGGVEDIKLAVRLIQDSN
jgi:uncharacterized protein (TIGR02145 family)